MINVSRFRFYCSRLAGGYGGDNREAEFAFTGEGLNRSETMNNFAMFFAAVMLAAAAAMMLGGQPASAASLNGAVQRSEMTANTAVKQVHWHRRWRSHHRHGSGHRRDW
jgi:hypothetical protein